MSFLTYPTKINYCKKILKEAHNTVILSGAGLETASGIATFRGKDGIYSIAPEQTLHINTFWQNTNEVLSFIKKYLYHPNALPNEAHKLLASLESDGKKVCHITQNITTLAELAGASNVIHVHGKIDTATCCFCGRKYETKDIFENYICSCNNEALIKPDIVFYGESIQNEFEAFETVKKADVFLILGTSLTVAPIAELPMHTKKDTQIILINNSSTYIDDELNVTYFREDIIPTLRDILK